MFEFDTLRLHPAVTNEDGVFQAATPMIHSPFEQGRSPWELFLVPQTETNHLTVLLRLHHCLGDGMSIIKMFNLMVDGGKMPMPKPTPNNGGNILKKICLPFLAAYDLSIQTLQPIDSNSWHLPKEKLLRKPNSCLSLPIPMRLVKDIKNETKSSFAGVVLASFAGGLRTFMLENGFEVPDIITVGASLPFPGHPDKMRNHL